MEELNKVVRAIGSFIVACILFACPITMALLIQANRWNFFVYILAIASISEFAFVVFAIYFHSGED